MVGVKVRAVDAPGKHVVDEGKPAQPAREGEGGQAKRYGQGPTQVAQLAGICGPWT